MTALDAIEILKANYPDSCYGELREAVDCAIEALTPKGKIQYRIIVAEYINKNICPLDEIANKIQEFCNSGWIPQGNLIYIPPVNDLDRYRICQAMIKN